MQTDACRVVQRFIDAFARADRAGIEACLAPDLIAGVTQADGSTHDHHGRDAYLAAVDAMDIATIGPDISVPQMVAVGPGEVLVMVEIKAERPGRSLHNFAAFLMRVEEGRITRMWMVEALPAESAAFWAP